MNELPGLNSIEITITHRYNDTRQPVKSSSIIEVNGKFPDLNTLTQIVYREFKELYTNTQYTSIQKSNYIVFRPSEELKGRVSKHYDGYWYDRNQIPMEMQPERPGNWNWGKAHPSGKFETRDDGAVAEVWIVETNEEIERRNDN